jgi:hypothetical protein
MAELPGDQLERGAGARHPDGPVVPGIVQAIAVEPECAQSIPMHLTRLPAFTPRKSRSPGSTFRRCSATSGRRVSGPA